MTLPIIFGFEGPALSADERAFFREADPAGYILFARNCIDPAQLRGLTGDLRGLHGRADLLILIDQEGGRVARLKPPHWPAFPAADEFAALYEKAPMTAIEAARHNAAAMAAILAEAGVNVNCAPVLDLAHEGAHDIVGDRSHGADPLQVAALGRAVLDGLHSGGVLGCIKHMPGHGRCAADSHHELPVVNASRDELQRDFAPFRTLAPCAAVGMVAHVLYRALDPGRPASISPQVIAETIRGDIGFAGLLLSDDIAMKALAGTPAETARAVVDAGCDLALHCSGELPAMEQAAAALDETSSAASERLAAACSRLGAGAGGYEEAAALRDRLVAAAGR
ncbi:MAG TPA: beta-N-acetylhexosaminidase [Allosphingosinicella sp.]